MHCIQDIPYDNSLLAWILVIFFGVMLFMSGFSMSSNQEISGAIPSGAASEIPPPWVFMIVWPILYALIAVALWHSYRVTRSHAWFWFALVGLLLNFLWVPVFLSPNGASNALNILTLLIVVTAFQFVYLLMNDRQAAALFVPYLVWLLFAWRLNRSLVDYVSQVGGVVSA